MDGHSSKPDSGDYKKVTEGNVSIADGTDWDGSEAEIIEDEDAEKFEDKYTGIKLCYTLDREEIKESVKILKSKLKHRYIAFFKKSNIVKTVILAFAFICFLLSYFMGYGVFNLIMSGVCVLTAGLMWYAPILDRKKNISENMFKGTYNVKIYPDEVEVEIVNGKKKANFIIPMDETSEFAEIDDMLVILTGENRILTIPIRAIEPSIIADVQGILFTGTKELKNED